MIPKFLTGSFSYVNDRCFTGQDEIIRALTVYPDLHFELYHVLEGVNSVVIYYKSVGDRLATEMMVLNEAGKVTEVRAHYKQVEHS